MIITATQMQTIGIKCTTVCKLGGIGLGYQLPDDCFKAKKHPTDLAWQSGGNGHYYAKKFKTVTRDNGKGYIDAARGIISNAI